MRSIAARTTLAIENTQGAVRGLATAAARAMADQAAALADITARFTLRQDPRP